MIKYTVFLRILGGKWARYPLPNGEYETDDLALAFGLAATLKDPIKEAAVIRVTSGLVAHEDGPVVVKTYELIE